MANLSAATQDYILKRDELLRLYPELAGDDQALLDTLDGETSLTEALIALLRSADDAEAHAAGIKLRAQELAERKVRLETRATTLRKVALNAMERAGIPKLVAPDFTASVSAARPIVVITDEALLPPAYVKTERSPKKADIAAALKSGQEVPGAAMSNGGTTLRVSKR